MVTALVLVGVLAMVGATDASVRDETVCQGRVIRLDCPPKNRLEILSANYGRTNKPICASQNSTSVTQNHCISVASRKIIEGRCDGRRFCIIQATSSALGGDPCPTIPKYLDIIYHCVPKVRSTGAPKKPTFIDTTKLSKITIKPSENRPTRIPTYSSVAVTVFTENVLKTNKKDDGAKAIRKTKDRGFFSSLLILLAIAKEKPKHSMLSVLTGVAAGTVVILITVLICVCVDKRRRKNGCETFSDSEDKKGEVVELESRELLGAKMGMNADSQSARTDDHVDSAFGDDEVDRRVSNDYEIADDMAFLDNYLKEYNANKTLPRPSEPADYPQDGGPRRMSRRAHNDGSKGRSYVYNSNNNHSFTTFT